MPSDWCALFYTNVADFEVLEMVWKVQIYIYNFTLVCLFSFCLYVWDNKFKKLNTYESIRRQCVEKNCYLFVYLSTFPKGGGLKNDNFQEAMRHDQILSLPVPPPDMDAVDWQWKLPSFLRGLLIRELIGI